MANYPYTIISDISMVETTVNKSRFIAVAFPVTNVEEVKEALGSLKKSNKDASHIAYAYLLGGDYSVARNNDDGEPAGSAGAPIYEAIREKRITNILVAVVRFFGGVELGKSKLTRVYYNAALNAIVNCRKSRMLYCGIYDMKVNYEDYATLGKVLAERGFPIIEKNFDESMPKIKCAMPLESAEKAIAEIRARLKESAQMIKIDEAYYRFPYNM